MIPIWGPRNDRCSFSSWTLKDDKDFNWLQSHDYKHQLWSEKALDSDCGSATPCVISGTSPNISVLVYSAIKMRWLARSFEVLSSQKLYYSGFISLNDLGVGMLAFHTDWMRCGMLLAVRAVCQVERCVEATTPLGWAPRQVGWEEVLLVQCLSLLVLSCLLLFKCSQ